MDREHVAKWPERWICVKWSDDDNIRCSAVFEHFIPDDGTYSLRYMFKSHIYSNYIKWRLLHGYDECIYDGISEVFWWILTFDSRWWDIYASIYLQISYLFKWYQMICFGWIQEMYLWRYRCDVLMYLDIWFQMMEHIGCDLSSNYRGQGANVMFWCVWTFDTRWDMYTGTCRKYLYFTVQKSAKIVCPSSFEYICDDVVHYLVYTSNIICTACTL